MVSRLFGLGLLSASMLCVEIALTRLFSTLYYPPFVFAILSLAVLGIGLGAGLSAWYRPLRQETLVPRYVALAGLSTLLVLVATLLPGIPVLRPLPLALVVLPFLFAGLAIATLFSHTPNQSPQLYLADLLGAGAGALLVIPVLNQLGMVNGVLAVVIALGVTALLFRRKEKALLPWSVLALGVVVLATHVNGAWLDLDPERLPVQKPLSDRLQNGGQVIQTVWDAFARTDLIDPGNGAPYELYLDGAAGSLMPPLADDELWQDIGLFPFATEQPERVFVIGPGGGLDVWFGMQSGAQEIVAVEVNPASVALVNQFASYNGDLYGQPGVHVRVDEGRSVLQRENRQYDLIFLSQVVTLAAERSGYALVENSTYTVEAFQIYLDHLQDGGLIALKLYDEATLTRALATALAVFRQQGRSDAEALQHSIALLDPRTEPPIPLLMVRKTPFSREDALSIGAVARQVGFTPLFLPHVWAQPPLDSVAAGERPFAAIIAESEHDIHPTTDDRPFFFQFEQGIPRSLHPLLWGLGAVLMLGGVLLIASQRSDHATPARWLFLYFAALGLAFMLAEIAIIQQTRLFLGHPTLAVTIVLATLLVGGGIGSGVAGRWFRSKLSIRPLLAVAGLMPLWLLAWTPIEQTFITAPPAWRVVIVAATLLPLALFMGMPFPLGLRAIGRFGDRPVALAWMVNGVTSVAGSVAAVTLALTLGYSRVLLSAWIIYLLAMLVVFLLPRNLKTVL